MLDYSLHCSSQYNTRHCVTGRGIQSLSLLEVCNVMQGLVCATHNNHINDYAYVLPLCVTHDHTIDCMTMYTMILLMLYLHYM